MDQTALINIGLALIGFIAVILLFILRAINNLNSLLETMNLKPQAAAVPTASAQTVAADGISEEEVAAISAVFAKMMPEKKISSIRLQ